MSVDSIHVVNMALLILVLVAIDRCILPVLDEIEYTAPRHCDDILPCPKCHTEGKAVYMAIRHKDEWKWRRVCMACQYPSKAHTTMEQADVEWAREYDYNVMMERLEKKKQDALENLEREYSQSKI